MNDGIGEGSLPNVILVGPGRTGTTSLFQLLGQHPDIGVSKVKETGYFRGCVTGQPLAPLGQYAAHFDHAAGYRIRLEATPNYFLGGRTMARTIRQTLGPIRVVVTFREPLERLFSVYKQVRNKVLVDGTLTYEAYLDRAHKLADRLPVTPEEMHFLGIRESAYARLLAEWQEVMGRDNVFVMFYEQYADDPIPHLERLACWLGVAPDPLRAIGLPDTNRSIAYRSAGLQRAALWTAKRLEPVLWRIPRIKIALRDAYYALNGRPSGTGPGAQTQAALKQEFASETQALAALLRAQGHTDLPDWLPGPSERDRANTAGAPQPLPG